MSACRTVDFTQAALELQRADRWLILVHEKPDGDALGSGSALYQAGLAMGKEVRWGGIDSFPDTYSFLEGARDYCQLQTLPGDLRAGDLVICLDTSNAERSVPGLTEARADVRILNADHHADNAHYGTWNLVDPSAAATAEMVWLLLESMGRKLTVGEALSLYTGIVTDTGRFAFRATSPRTHRVAASLLEAGLDPQKADSLVFHNRTLEAFHLWGRAFSRARHLADKQAVVSWLLLDDFSDTRARPEETEGLVNDLLTVKGARFAALLTEAEEEIRVSLRSDGALSAGNIARSLGGGGHEQAAGFRCKGTLEEARGIVCERIRTGFDELLPPG